MENFKEEVANLKILSDDDALIKEKIKQKKLDFEKEIEADKLKLDEITKQIAESKEILSEDAKKQFNEDKSNKKLYGGIGIQVGTAITYDKKEALKFAKEKDMFLLLDVKNFEKTAKTLDLDFVTIEKDVIKVTFPKEIKLD